MTFLRSLGVTVNRCAFFWYRDLKDRVLSFFRKYLPNVSAGGRSICWQGLMERNEIVE